MAWHGAQTAVCGIAFALISTGIMVKNALQVGWSPTYTLTEDFALGMELKKNKWHCRYVNEYLAVGEAPDQIRNCFQQRSRWTKVQTLQATLHVYGHLTG